MYAMQFRMLGALEVVADGAVAELGPPKQRALLASLLLHVGEIVSVDRLTELLWGENAPRTAAHSIQMYVSDLRRALEPLGGSDLIITRQPGYVLEVDPDSIDAWQFERHIREGVRLLEAGDPEAGRAALRGALALWRGPALADFSYEEFAQPYIRRLNEAHLDAIEALAAAELDAGRTTEVVGLLEAAVLEDPLRERSRELLMLALYRSGRHADALRTYDALRTQLADELGVDPSPPIRGLYDRILLHDPMLLPRVEDAAGGTEVRNPYKGLRAFTEADAPDFFGREDLVDQLLEALGRERLVSLVGPSGSGKSSVVAAGLVPRIRAGALPGSERWRIARMAPGPSPLREAEAVVARVSAESGRASSESGSASAGPGGLLAAAAGGDPTLLIVDQFEQVFSVAEETSRHAFLDAIARSVTAGNGRLRVILTLRADFYDRPLLHPAFAAIFGPSVVNVVPMNPQDLEAAVVEPAQRVGVEVEPALLAQLVAETADRPGSLPLLQYALTELFDQRTGPALTQAGYASLGGLRGLLSRRAESLYLGLDPEAQAAAMQVFLRLVQPGNGAAASRRRVALAELTDLGIDPVILSEVLATFGRHRLLTFDREAVSGQATVEVAHEALLDKWERLAAWIDRHSAVLRRHGALVIAAEEWEASGRNPDYLLAGSRLDEFEPWLAGGVLRLSGGERAFLEAAVERRRSAEAAEIARVDAQRRAERRTRWRFAALAATVVLLAGGLTYAVIARPGAPPARVQFFSYGQGLLFEQIESGFDRAVADLGLVGAKTKIRDIPNADREMLASQLRRISGGGWDLVVVFDFPDVESIAREFPAVRYLALDAIRGEAPNVAVATFREWEAAFLVGAAAALKTQTGTIGVVGGWDGVPIWGFVAGYEAGAAAVRPGIDVLVTYLGAYPDMSVFNNPSGAEAVARRMYAEGADVVFAAAGESGLGVFQAAHQMSREPGSHLWAIGVDSDQYETVGHLTGALQAEEWRPHILTSMLKRFDVVVADALTEFVAGSFSIRRPPVDLASGGIDISYSGGFIDDIRPTIESYRSQIVEGAITVPCIPDDRLGVVEEIAREEGVTFEEVMSVICP
jgi:basic membrane lipoprotein Med (substrate-binding protein (PBP1-ABC) superfamily)/DNA-binding SARP family transcriptional activator